MRGCEFHDEGRDDPASAGRRFWRKIKLSITLGLIAGSAYAQLHLISGTPAANADIRAYALKILRVNAGGKVQEELELETAEQGVEWMSVSYEFGLLVVLPRLGGPTLVVDISTGRIVKSCDQPKEEAGTFLVGKWLSDVPGRGPSLQRDVYGPGERKQVKSMLLDPAVPCSDSFSVGSYSDVQYVIAHGTTGVGEHGATEGVSVDLGDDGRLGIGANGAMGHFQPIVPQELLRGLSHPYTGAIANTKSVLLIAATQDAESSTRFFAFRKRDKTWHTIPGRSDFHGLLAVFGPYISLTEATGKKAAAGQAKKGTVNRDTLRREGESTGRSEWRNARTATGPDQVDEFETDEAVFPGRLHIYDIDTERLYTITTNQADSEVLLIENKVVYYRVSDRLYSAQIGGSGISVPTLVAKDELIRDSHWAFITH